MSWLDSLSQEKDTQNELDSLRFTAAPPVPGLLKGIGESAKGVPKGLIEATNLADQVFGKVGEFIGPAKSEEQKAGEEISRQNVAAMDREVYDLDGESVGAAGQVLYGLGKIVPRTFLGTITGGPVGGAVAAGAPEGFESAEVAKAQGLDENIANVKGIIDGTTTGAGMLLPGGHILKGALPDFLLTTGANTGFGALSRYADHTLLKAAGYDAQAEQYKALDGQALLTDAVLGAAFFGIARSSSAPRPTPVEVDAALTANQAHHAQIDSAPGIPATPSAARAHVESLEDAVKRALRGEPVRVSDAIREADFVVKQPEPPPTAAIRDFDPESDPIATATARIIGLESGGRADAKNKRSTATGAGQFLDGTWLNLVRAERPELAAGKTPEQLLALRTDPALAKEMVAAYARQNAQALRSAGLPDSAANLYLAHHFGPRGAIKLLQADRGALMDTLLTKAELKANPTYRGKSVGEVMDSFDRRAGVEPTRGTEPARSELVDQVHERLPDPQPRRPGTPEVTPAPDAVPDAATPLTESNAIAAPHPAGKDAGKVEPIDPYVAAAQEILTRSPDLALVADDGEPVPAADALAHADTVVARADADARGFQAAMSCFLRVSA